MDNYRVDQNWIVTSKSRNFTSRSVAFSSQNWNFGMTLRTWCIQNLCNFAKSNVHWSNQFVGHHLICPWNEIDWKLRLSICCPLGLKFWPYRPIPKFMQSWCWMRTEPLLFSLGNFLQMFGSVWWSHRWPIGYRFGVEWLCAPIFGSNGSNGSRQNTTGPARPSTCVRIIGNRWEPTLLGDGMTGWPDALGSKTSTASSFFQILFLYLGGQCNLD